MSKPIPFVCTDTKITVNFNGQTHIVPRTDPLADKLLEALRARNWDEIPHLVSTARRIEKFSDGMFVVEDDQILIDGVPAPQVLGTKIVRFANENLPYEPLVQFARNLQKNPSYRAVQELFQFLEKNDHPITENGNFIAYKKVRSDFLDIHSRSFDNSPGKVVEVPRNQVDEDSTVTCSRGLHVANWDYAKNHYGSDEDIMLEVEVNPADVVAIPVDYNQSKMRVCKYVVIGVVDRAHSSDVSLRTTGTIWDSPAHTMTATHLDHLVDGLDEESEEDEYYDEESSSSDDEYNYDEESESLDEDSEDDEYPWDDELDV